MAGLDMHRPVQYISNLKEILNFFSTIAERVNYPMPPFEEVKYYQDSSVTKPMVDLLVERLKCF